MHILLLKEIECDLGHVEPMIVEVGDVVLADVLIKQCLGRRIEVDIVVICRRKWHESVMVVLSGREVPINHGGHHKSLRDVLL